VLGSIHDRHPKLLLPQAVFKVIEELSGQTVPFMEHVSPYEYLIQKLPETNDQSKEFWNPEMDFKLSENDIKIWQAIKDEPIYIDGPKVEDIVKMDETLGVMLFYIVARKKSEEIGIALGFETTIYDKQWQEEFCYLEKLEECLPLIKQEDRISYFKNGLQNFSKIIQIQGTQNIQKLRAKILVSYKQSIHSYDYEKFLDYQNVKTSSLERNKHWSDTVTKYLTTDDNKNIISPLPLLIVCGANHLRGGILKDSHSFLEYLWDTKHFSSIDRMDKDGKWLNLI
jgi:hypothetical protein